MSEVRSFPPIARRDARVLILGSVPSAASLAARQYYAHPRNAFWPLMGELVGAHRELPYARRIARLKASGIAVWDVLESCFRPTSLDSDIVAASIAPNDLAGFFRDHPRVERVFFNGGMAETSFRRYVCPTLPATAKNLVYRRLPSSSPAHAGRSFTDKLASWRAILEALER